MIWVYLNAQPVRQFYRDAAALVLLDPLQAQHARLRAVSLLRDEAAGESANLSVELDNTDRALTALWADPPVGAELLVYDDGVAVFEGIVADVVLAGDAVRLEVAA